MTRLHSNDNEREQARQLRCLLVRLEDGWETDQTVGIDILYALDAPSAIGDPILNMDCAVHLAKWMRQPVDSVLNAATAALRNKVRGGWKNSGSISNADVARSITGVLVRVCLAKLEGAPA